MLLPVVLLTCDPDDMSRLTEEPGQPKARRMPSSTCDPGRSARAGR